MNHLLWEQHCCLPLVPDADLTHLLRYRRPGGALVSVNVGYSPHTADDVRDLAGAWRDAVQRTAGLHAAATVADVDAAAAREEVAVVFDLEDSGPLEGRLERVAEFHRLGVRTLGLTYNVANAAGGGCLDEDAGRGDTGLTAYGRDLVAELERVGIVPDGSHCSRRTGLDVCGVATGPVVYSHSCLQSVWDHPRNVSDEQVRACAATGGVVGVTGVGIFLGPNDVSLQALLRHVDRAVSLVGVEHVGLSTDNPFDAADFTEELLANPHLFPDSYTRWGPIEFVTPETFLTLPDALAGHGYSPAEVQALTGGNFRRVAQRVWGGRSVA